MNFNDFLSGSIFFGLVFVLNDILHSYIQILLAKRANYDCNKCGVFDCPYPECMKRRKNRVE